MPNFGKDSDINDMQDNIALAEKDLKHSWAPQTDAEASAAAGKPVWIMPQAAPESSYVYKEYMLTGLDTEEMPDDDEVIGIWVDNEKSNEFRPVENGGLSATKKAPWHNPDVGSARTPPTNPSYPVPDFGVD